MSKRCTCFVSLILLLALIQGSAVRGAWDPLADPTLAGWWSFDEGVGTTAADSSANGRDGTLQGGATWTTGRFGGGIQLDGTSGYVSISSFPLTTDSITMVAWINGWKANSWAAVISGQPARLELGFGDNSTLHYTWNDDASTTWSWTGGPTIPQDSWAMLAVTIDTTKAIAYVYTDAAGLSKATNSISHVSQTFSVLQIGWSFDTRYVRGILDEVAIYSRALTEEEIQILTQGPTDPALAGDPAPPDEATDVPQDAVLSWTAGEGAITHDLYFGTSYEDISAATQPNLSQTDTTYDPEGLLTFGQTYFWRVDETTADGARSTGPVWSFTAEPYTYAIDGDLITATASSQYTVNTGPEKTINGSGLNENDEHSMVLDDMWLSAKNGPQPPWIQYEFDKPYTLDRLIVWNSNQLVEFIAGLGIKDVTIDYSLDGVEWTTLGDFELAQAPGESTYVADSIIEFGTVTAKYVKLTANSNWGGISPQCSLSEVRFYHLPVQAREPDPADGETQVALDETLNWRPGRMATSHTVYFGDDANAVAEGTASTSTVTDHRYSPSGMEFGTAYYWRVDEVGEAGTYAGNVWSFTSQEFAPIDDFESYNDTDNFIFDIWLDGYVDKSSGSQVGYTDSAKGTFNETSITHNGSGQSMPVLYDNSQSPYYSEIVRTWPTAQNWTGNGATEVSLWTYGYPAPAPVTVSETAGKIAVTGAGADIWSTSDQFTFAYKTLTGNGTMVARVISSGTGSSTWAKGGVMIRDSLRGGSTHAMMVMTTTGTNGASFQYRAATDGDSATTDSITAVAVPYWVKIERSADYFTGYTSADGKTWSTVGSAAVDLVDPVYIGLCVTSHAAGEERTFEFDSITSTGTVTGDWTGVVIENAEYNDAANMHLYIEDSNGKGGTVISDTAVTVADWTRWAVPMNDFGGVNFSKVKKMVITIGDKGTTTPGGKGQIFIDDIGYGRSAGQ